MKLSQLPMVKHELCAPDTDQGVVAADAVAQAAAAGEVAMSDSEAELWQPGTNHDDEVNPCAVYNACHPVREGHAQIKIDWARVNAMLSENSSSPSKNSVDRASGPDVPAGPELRRSSCLATQRTPWYLLGGTALFGVGCALGFGIAISAGLGNESCAIPDTVAPQPLALALQMHAIDDILGKCREDLLEEQSERSKVETAVERCNTDRRKLRADLQGERSERSRAKTAMDQCNVERKNLLEQLHWLAANVAKPSI